MKQWHKRDKVKWLCYDGHGGECWWYGEVVRVLMDGCVFVEFTSPQAAVIELEANELEAA